MRILFEQTGGFMGRTVDLNLDLKDLPEDQAETLRQLLEQANFFGLEENLARQSYPDAYQYQIKVETERMEHTVHASDGNVPESLRPLVDELSKRARLQRI